MFPAWPYFAPDEVHAASCVLQSGAVNSWTGNHTSLFENEFATYVGSKHAIAICNGSLALYAALYSLGVTSGDEVITTPRTFIATASSSVLLGAIPIFADVDIDSGNITVDTIEPLITSKTKAIVVVHLGGWPADMPSILNLASSYGIPVVEDCAQAHGAGLIIDSSFHSVGSFADISCWSFCQDKIITTGGEGGMITTSRDDLWDFVWSFKDHGKSFEKVTSPSSSNLLDGFTILLALISVLLSFNQLLAVCS